MVLGKQMGITRDWLTRDSSVSRWQSVGGIADCPFGIWSDQPIECLGHLCEVLTDRCGGIRMWSTHEASSTNKSFAQAYAGLCLIGNLVKLVRQTSLEFFPAAAQRGDARVLLAVLVSLEDEDDIIN